MFLIILQWQMKKKKGVTAQAVPARKTQVHMVTLPTYGLQDQVAC